MLTAGLRPSMKSTSKNPRSTVGTITEVYDYLRLLYARAGRPHCPTCGAPIERQTPQQIVDRVLALEEGRRFQVLAPVVRGRKGEFVDLFRQLQTQGFSRARVDGAIHNLDDPPKLDKKIKHTVEVVVDRLAVKSSAKRRLTDSVETERGLDRVGEAALRGLLHREAVDHDLDRVLELLVERRRLVERVGLSVDAGPAEALLLELAEQLDVLTLAAADDRGEHLEPAPLLQREDAVDDLLRRLPLDRRAARGAVRPAGPCVEEPEVVVDLGDRADRRPGVLRGRLLVDRHRRGEALDEVDVGLVHLPEELAGVGRE